MSNMYYDDPLAVIYMNREYNVRFTDGENEIYVYPLTEVPPPADCEDDYYYIHTDSISVFKPQEGDLVRDNMMGCSIIREIIDRDVIGGKERIYMAEMPSNLRIGFIKEIIQRDNKPFFMPITKDKDDA